ncbi:MAG: hypothetical protein E7348_06620 [Clostridiales bacterium]|nr:hypothetical protein [Clostridiales bacterium]
MSEELKSLKQYCREAKKRLKSGFWERYRENLEKELEQAKTIGVPESKVREYFTYTVTNGIEEKKDSEQEFYIKVKTLLDSEGEVSNVIGRLTDKEYFDTLSYEEKQRYNLTLSERYLKALERYKKEKALEYKA